MKDTYLCKCNNCESILIDENPQTDAILHDLKEYPQAKDMIQYHDGGEFYWGCPNGCGDSFLTDEI